MTRRLSVTRIFTLDAAHQLPDYPGPCARLHGHTYRLEVTVGGNPDLSGMVIDFADLKKLVATNVLDHFDHTFLNDLIPNPTVENVADDFLNRLLGAGLNVVRLRLWETPTCYADVVP